MTSRPHGFKRVVVGLHPAASDRAVQLAVEFALLMNLDLLGLFVEDSGLRDLAGNPLAREFRPLNGGWHALDLDRLTSDLELAARGAARMFADAVRRLSTRSRFEVVRGPTAQTITALSRGGDIMLVVEPAGAAERIAQQLAWSAEAAFRSVAAVMLVPRRVVRTVGPVVAIAASPLDPSIDTAAGIAAAAREQLVVLRLHDGAAEETRIGAIAAETGIEIRQIFAGRGAQSDAAALSALLDGARERLVVVSRDRIARDVAAALAATRHVPVLVIEPAPDD